MLILNTFVCFSLYSILVEPFLYSNFIIRLPFKRYFIHKNYFPTPLSVHAIKNLLKVMSFLLLHSLFEKYPQNIHVIFIHQLPPLNLTPLQLNYCSNLFLLCFNPFSIIILKIFLIAPLYYVLDSQFLYLVCTSLGYGATNIVFLFFSCVDF